jgi:exonuclease III
MINNMDLVDVWREKHPGIRKYTWRGPDKKQSGLDYFLVSSDIKKYFVSDIQSFTKIHHFHNIFWSYTYHHLFL